MSKLIAINIVLISALLATLPARALMGGVKVGPEDRLGSSVVELILLTRPKDSRKAYDDQFICTGTLVRSDVVLTAAHCIGALTGARIHRLMPFPDGPDMGEPEGFPVLIVKSADGKSFRSAIRVAAHPDYFLDTGRKNDVGLIRLEEPLSAPVARMDFETVPQPGQNITVYGAGTTGYKGGFLGVGATPLRDGLKKQTVPVIAKKDASYLLPKFEDAIYIRNPSTGGTCSGDSGSPGFMNGAIVTVHSYAAFLGACKGDSGQMSVAKHREWIQGTISGWKN